MKLLFLTVIPSPYQRQLFSQLAQDDSLEITVLYFSGMAREREWSVPTMSSYEKIMPGRTLSFLGLTARWNKGVMQDIKRAKPDLVVVSDYSALTAQLAMRMLPRHGIPFVFWGEVPGFSKRGPVGSFLRRRLQAPLAKAVAIVGIGSVAEDAYRSLFPGKPIFNIPYFCDLEAFRKAGRKAAEKRPTVDILFSGQMIRRKGVDILLRAFMQIAPDHPHLRLLLLGNGPERHAFEEMVPTPLRERVIFLGHQDPKDLPETFSSADIFCLPSRHDGWGVVVNEALGAGLPIVVTETVGAGRDLVQHGDNGFIVPSEDFEKLSETLGTLSLDASLRSRMAERSSELSRRWDIVEGSRLWKKVSYRVLNDTGSSIVTEDS